MPPHRATLLIPLGVVVPSDKLGLSGWGQTEDRARTREAGFDDHLVKPIDYHALLRAIEKPAPMSAMDGE